MEKKQWVQHISGQGEKWEVYREDGIAWNTKAGDKGAPLMWLPKSEYRLCDPPEVWRDVSSDVDESRIPGNWIHRQEEVVGTCNGYRLRKVQLWQPAKETPGVCVFPPQYTLQWAFIVEQKVSQ